LNGKTASRLIRNNITINKRFTHVATRLCCLSPFYQYTTNILAYLGLSHCRNCIKRCVPRNRTFEKLKKKNRDSKQKQKIISQNTINEDACQDKRCVPFHV